MNRKHGSSHYTTRPVQDDQEGWIGLELSRTSGGHTEAVARILFWDAEGQFALEMNAAELPLVIVEELIAEAKSSVRTR